MIKRQGELKNELYYNILFKKAATFKYADELNTL